MKANLLLVGTGILTLGLSVSSSNPACAAPDLPAAGPPSTQGQEGLGSALAQQIQEARSASDVTSAITASWTSSFPECVPPLIARLSDRRVAGHGPETEVLVCDYAGEALQCVVGVRQGEARSGVFFLGTRSERDAAIKAWQQWWEANKEVSPELWLQKALDPAFETIAGNANGRPVGLAAEKIRVTFGTDFDIGNLVYSSAAFAPELAAARSIAGAWWTQHRAEPLTQLKRSAANVATIFKPAVAYQSFIAGNKLQEQVHLDAPHTGGLATGLPEIDRIVARAASGDPVAQAAAAPALRSALGTDFGLESFLSCPDFKDAARAATEVLADWWGYYKHRPVTEINESVASYETILQLSRRHVDMVRDELGKNPKPPGPTTKASGI